MLRSFVALAALALIVGQAADARALGDVDKLALAQLVYDGHWNPRPSAPRRLAWEIEKRTSVETVATPPMVRLDDDKSLRRYPLLYMAGDAAFAAPSDAEVGRLRRYLQAGGMLVIDSADPQLSGGFDRSVRALVKRLFPRTPLRPLSPDHVIYKSFYLLGTPVGRVAAVPYLEAVLHDGRAAIVYSRNDLGGAWARDDYGQWEHECYPGGQAQREMAFRLGINLVMYALCLDYKSDQVHVPFILRRRQWR